ncbi:MAG TPA: hypothetical protein VEO94_01515, partial [Candidatus Dormibacteraeota bacterium]|nr:hypothetical protein [Candidatus Dormibacteraeota bacterium]
MTVSAQSFVVRVLLIAATAVGPPVVWAQEGGDAAAPAGGARAVSVEELVKRGNQERREGRVRDAIASYGKARDLAPHTYEIRILLADTL